MDAEQQLQALAAPVRPLDEPAMARARVRWDTRAKPPGSLGRIEDLGVQLAGIAGSCPPPVPTRPTVTVFAGDHGAVADGASAWPSEVTQAMAATMAAGGAAINAFARSVGASVTVVDVGIAGPTPPGVVDRKVRPGTGSIATGAAMDRAEAVAAILSGAAQAHDAIAAGADLLVGGEMGIGNTAASAALIATLTGAAPAAVVGSGAGLPADRMPTKAAIVAAATARAAGHDDPVDVLAEIGGLEIAALAGWYLAGAAAHVPVVADGVISLAALCVADAIAPGTAARTVAGHRSAEPAASVALVHLGLAPLLDLELRLGEGTGACLAVTPVVAAARALAEMADLPT